MITLLYIRPEGDGTELDVRVQSVAHRYESQVSLRVVAPDELGQSSPGLLPTQYPVQTPAVYLLRKGVVISEAVGAQLPSRELDRAVQRAVELSAPA